jgi:hypothetical protein
MLFGPEPDGHRLNTESSSVRHARPCIDARCRSSSGRPPARRTPAARRASRHGAEPGRWAGAAGLRSTDAPESGSPRGRRRPRSYRGASAPRAGSVGSLAADRLSWHLTGKSGKGWMRIPFIDGSPTRACAHKAPVIPSARNRGAAPAFACADKRSLGSTLC